jgi:hypothetical protein
VPEVKGSARSEDFRLIDGEACAVLGFVSEEENGCAERRRTAWVMVG